MSTTTASGRRVDGATADHQPLPAHGTVGGDRSERPIARRGRIWLQDVDVEVTAMRGDLRDLRALRSRSSVDPTATGVEGLVESVGDLLDHAECAAAGTHPHHRHFWSWWNGDCVEAAYRNMHRAEAEIAKLYDDERADALVPEAVARLNGNLPKDDPRREDVAELRAAPITEKVQRLSRAIQIGHEAKDQSFARVRRFRNIINTASLLITIFVTAFTIFVAWHPATVPLCFDAAPPTGLSSLQQFCPSRGPTGPGGVASRDDVIIVVLLGLMGGSLAAAVSIRNIRGTPTPYNLATSLAILKVPTGALTAIGALILIRGQAVVSAEVASQTQVLAYALVFGYAQQVLTRLIDQRARTLAVSIPTKGAEGGTVPSPV